MVKNPPANAGDSRDTDQIPGSGISPGGGNVNAEPEPAPAAEVKTEAEPVPEEVPEEGSPDIVQAETEEGGVI